MVDVRGTPRDPATDQRIRFLDALAQTGGKDLDRDLERLRDAFPSEVAQARDLMRKGASLAEIAAAMRASLPRDANRGGPTTPDTALRPNGGLTAFQRMIAGMRGNDGLSGAAPGAAARASVWKILPDLLTRPSAIEDQSVFQREAARKQLFDRNLRAASSTPDTLAAFARDNVDRPLGPAERIGVMRALFGQNKFAEAARWYEDSVRVNREFGAHDQAAELYMVALNKSGNTVKAIDHALRYMSSRTRADMRQLTVADLSPDNPRLQGQRLRGDLLGGLGRAFRDIADRPAGAPLDPDLERYVRDGAGFSPTEPKTDAELRQAALEISTRVYATGFRVDGDYYPGINAVNQNLRMGRIAEAEALAPLVQNAVDRAGGLSATDKWTVSTARALAMLNRDYDLVPEALARELKHTNQSWEIKTNIESLERLITMRSGSDQRILQATLEQLKALQAKDKFPPSDEDIAAVRDSVSAVIEAETGRKPQLPALQAELDRGFRFNGAGSTFAGVQIAGAPGEPPIDVNRADVAMARALLEKQGLDQTSDVDRWMRSVNRMLGSRGSGDEAAAWADLLKLTQVGTSRDSRTNLMARLALGMRDPSTVGLARQLLFDTWKDQRSTTLMGAIQDARARGDTAAAVKAERELRDLGNVQMLIYRDEGNVGPMVQGLVRMNDDRKLQGVQYFDPGQPSSVAPEPRARGRVATNVLPNWDDLSSFRVGGLEMAPPSVDMMIDDRSRRWRELLRQPQAVITPSGTLVAGPSNDDHGHRPQWLEDLFATATSPSQVALLDGLSHGTSDPLPMREQTGYDAIIDIATRDLAHMIGAPPARLGAIYDTLHELAVAKSEYGRLLKAVSHVSGAPPIVADTITAADAERLAGAIVSGTGEGFGERERQLMMALAFDHAIRVSADLRAAYAYNAFYVPTTGLRSFDDFARVEYERVYAKTLGSDARNYAAADATARQALSAYLLGRLRVIYSSR